MTDSSRTRPKNVVVVDADNPMAEVRGEFFWREDHDRLLAAARDQSFCDGFAEGMAAARRELPQRVVLRRRHAMRTWIGRLVLAVLLLSFLVSLVLTALQAVASRL